MQPGLWSGATIPISMWIVEWLRYFMQSSFKEGSDQYHVRGLLVILMVTLAVIMMKSL